MVGMCGLSLSACFNPRPSVRGDPSTCWTRWKTACFNPRPSVRGDNAARNISPDCILFQSTPLPFSSLSPTSFQSTPLCEGRLVCHKGKCKLRGFQSTPLREGRRIDPDCTRGIGWFQSTPLREGRRCVVPLSPHTISFQSTPLREGRQQMFPDFLKEFRNTSTNFVVLDEICGCEVPGLKTKGTKMWCEGSGDFMTAWGSHVRLCGSDTAYMILLFLLLRFAIFSKISPFSPHQRGICVCLLFGIGHVCAMAVRSSLRNAFESACISYGFKSLTYDGSMD